MARSLSNAKLLSAAAVDGITSAIKRCCLVDPCFVFTTTEETDYSTVFFLFPIDVDQTCAEETLSRHQLIFAKTMP